MNCKKCQSNNLIREPWTKVISPNEYRLMDKIICKDCKSLQIIDLAEIDKNTDNTKKLLTGNYVVNKNGDVVLKSKSKVLKDLAEEVQNEIKTAELFCGSHFHLSEKPSKIAVAFRSSVYIPSMIC